MKNNLVHPQKHPSEPKKLERRTYTLQFYLHELFFVDGNPNSGGRR
jgi:hypothetical protein